MATPIKHAVGTYIKFEQLKTLEEGKLYFALTGTTTDDFFLLFRAGSENKAIPISTLIPGEPKNELPDSDDLEAPETTLAVKKNDTLTNAFTKVQKRLKSLEEDAAKMFTVKGTISLSDIDHTSFIINGEDTEYTKLKDIPAEKGDAYRVTFAGNYNTGIDSEPFVNCEVGDWLVYTGTLWTVIQGNIDIEGLKQEIQQMISDALGEAEISLDTINVTSIKANGNSEGNFIGDAAVPFDNMYIEDIFLPTGVNEDGDIVWMSINDIFLKPGGSSDTLYVDHLIPHTTNGDGTYVGSLDNPYAQIAGKKIYVGKEDEQVEVGEQITNINSILQWENF